MKIIFKPGISFHPIDRSSDLYRKCPTCGREFMTDTRLRYHCNDVCKDRKAYLKRVDEKQASDALRAEWEEIQQQELKYQLKLESNIQILDDHPISSSGTKVNMVYLDSIGFDYLCYSKISELDIKESDEMHNVVHYGTYRLFRTEYGEVLVKKAT